MNFAILACTVLLSASLAVAAAAAGRPHCAAGPRAGTASLGGTVTITDETHGSLAFALQFDQTRKVFTGALVAPGIAAPCTAQYTTDHLEDQEAHMDPQPFDPPPRLHFDSGFTGVFRRVATGGPRECEALYNTCDFKCMATYHVSVWLDRRTITAAATAAVPGCTCYRGRGSVDLRCPAPATPTTAAAATTTTTTTASAGTILSTVFEFDGPVTRLQGAAAVAEKSRADLQLTKAFTASIWVKPTRRVDDWARVFGKGGQHKRNFGLWIDPDGRVLSQMFGTSAKPSAAEVFSKGATTPLDTWTHVAATFSKDNLHTLYINGTKVGSLATKGTPLTDNEPVTIGKATFHTGFEGVLARASLSSVAMTAEEVKAQFESGVVAMRGLPAATAPPTTAAAAYTFRGEGFCADAKGVDIAARRRSPASMGRADCEKMCDDDDSCTGYEWYSAGGATHAWQGVQCWTFPGVGPGGYPNGVPARASSHAFRTATCYTKAATTSMSTSTTTTTQATLAPDPFGCTQWNRPRIVEMNAENKAATAPSGPGNTVYVRASRALPHHQQRQLYTHTRASCHWSHMGKVYTVQPGSLRWPWGVIACTVPEAPLAATVQVSVSLWDTRERTHVPNMCMSSNTADFTYGVPKARGKCVPSLAAAHICAGYGHGTCGLHPSRTGLPFTGLCMWYVRPTTAAPSTTATTATAATTETTATTKTTTTTTTTTTCSPQALAEQQRSALQALDATAQGVARSMKSMVHRLRGAGMATSELDGALAALVAATTTGC